MTDWRIHAGDCREALAAMPDSSVDAIITDPPYELGFMGRAWDKSGVAFDPETWRAALRVAKPGAAMLAFGGTRTFHRLTCAIEDAGWEIRDCLMWLYGQGFPKSLNGEWGGTALKPGWEPVILARKPPEGTIAANYAAHGTGGLNIDDCRIFTDWSDRSEAWKASGHSAQPDVEKIAAPPGTSINCHPAGRWPANVLLDEDAAALLDEQSGILKTSGGRIRIEAKPRSVAKGAERPRDYYSPPSEGGASRFFYCAKPSTAEREAGCEHLPKRSAGELVDREDDSAGMSSPRAGAGRTSSGRANFHPTVKPIELMRYLCRLITPPGGTVLDLFAGSGTTGCGAVLEGFSFIGADLDPDHVRIAEARIAHWAKLADKQLSLFEGAA